MKYAVALSAVAAVVLQQQHTSAEYTPEALADQITALPGAEDLDISFNQFSGYLKVGDTKNLHYWMVESMGDPANDPIAFWTNGGPGCSGLLGFLTEQGPFRPKKDLTLGLNEYSWSTIANMVFIEAPCGVGFSYSDDKDDYKTGDAQTAIDNYELLQAFFDRFPQFRKNDLYITSESYGGHYMPTLAKEIVDHNADPASTYEPLNFKGFAVGNPATTFYSTIPASLETYWGHQLVDKPLWDKYAAKCIDYRIKKDWEECEYFFLAMYEKVGDGINPYAMDYGVCVDDSAENVLARGGRNQRAMLLNHLLGGMELGSNSTDKETTYKAMRKALKLEPEDGYDACEENYMIDYLNQDSVKAAIHVKQDIKWGDCSYTLRYDEKDGPKDMTGYYKYLIDGGFGLNILVYSGDDDDVCATVGTQDWIWDLGYKTAVGHDWKAYKVDGQTGGYLTKWRDTKLAFATVHGAGHEVPTYKPEVALYLWSSYLKGELTDK